MLQSNCKAILLSSLAWLLTWPLKAVFSVRMTRKSPCYLLGCCFNYLSHWALMLFCYLQFSKCVKENQFTVYAISRGLFSTPNGVFAPVKEHTHTENKLQQYDSLNHSSLKQCSIKPNVTLSTWSQD